MNTYVVKVKNLYASKSYFTERTGQPFVKDRSKALVLSIDEVIDSRGITFNILNEARSKGYQPTDVTINRSITELENIFLIEPWWSLFKTFKR